MKLSRLGPEFMPYCSNRWGRRRLEVVLRMPCLKFLPTGLLGNLNRNRLEEMSFSMKALLSSYWVLGTVPGPGNTSLTKVSMGYSPASG